MTRGPEIEIVIPENLNLTTYYLEENITRGRGDKVAVYCQDKRYTFSDLCNLTNRVGNVLKELGVGFEDRVLLILQDSPEWLAGWYATMKIGGVATHAYTYLLPSDYEYFLNYVRPKVVIVDPTTLERVREGARRSIFHRAILVAGEGHPPLDRGEYGLNDLISRASTVLETAATTKNDLAFWNFSGGTTGKSKGVPHMHHDGVVGFESFQHTVHYTPDDIVFRVPKLFFHYARDLGMNWPMRAAAAVALSPERSTAETVFQCLHKYRPTVLLNVPTMMRAMLQSPLARDANLSFLRLCISSGEPLSGQLYKEFRERFGVEVLNSIGSAETCLGYFLDTPGQVVPGASGKVQPLVEVKLVDEEGREVTKRETGILHVRSEASGAYYHLEHEKTKKTFCGNDWVNTNDLFREDENGYFWYEGRADDLIKVSGIYVAPLEIQKCLEEHRSVRECVVLGVKDADGLVKTKAFIVLNDGFKPSERLAEELQEHCRQKMAPFKAPRFIQFLSELPKTGQGKIDKRLLLERQEKGGMMHLPQFTYYAPKSVEEACSLLAKHKGSALPLAGGTDLLVKMKQRRIVPRYLVNLKAIPDIDYISYDENDGLRIGALATIQSLKNSVTVKRHCKILAQAAGVESSIQIRNVATLGGNIANASPAADAPLALIALGASVVLARAGGQREVSLENFFVGPGQTVLQPGEILSAIHVPPLQARAGGAYLKHAVRRTDIAIVSVAVVVRLDGDVCEDAKIALGSVAPTAFRAKKAERLLTGKRITDELAEEAAQAAMEESRPIDDIRGYAEYRAKMVLDITKQAIIQALQDARLGGI